MNTIHLKLTANPTETYCGRITVASRRITTRFAAATCPECRRERLAYLRSVSASDPGPTMGDANANR